MADIRSSTFNSFGSVIRRRRVAPTQTIGTGGTVIHGGFLFTDYEAQRSNQVRAKAYHDMLANVSIVAAGVRYFLNLAAKQEWAFNPSESDTTGEFAEAAHRILVEDPATSWDQVVRRGALFRFYGFSIQEWTAKRKDDYITIADIQDRPQKTFDRWDLDRFGKVLGMVQRNPTTQEEIYLPRGKTLYLVEDTLTDSPEGFGIFKHLESVAGSLCKLEALEQVGFDTDLRGVPVGRAPYAALAKEVAENNNFTQADMDKALEAIEGFMDDHYRQGNTALVLDSSPYMSTDDATRPSGVNQWDLDLKTTSSSAFPDLHIAISRKNKEMARIMGVEQLLLGADSAGSFALSKDKTHSFFLIVDGTLREMAQQVRRDLLEPLWALNGWPEEMLPDIAVEALRAQDVEQVVAALRDMAAAGATFPIDDPIWDEVRGWMGLPGMPEEMLADLAQDAALMREAALGNTNNEDEPMEDDDDTD